MQMNQLRAGIPALPPSMAHLPIDARGFPVPYFVAIVNGQPDHRVMDGSKMPGAVKRGLCWVCGKPLRGEFTFTIGPMCCITRTISEPASHTICARYSATACPFLSRPHAKRREIGLPEDAIAPAGVGIKRNPGATCLWTTDDWTVDRLPPGSHEGRPGILFALGDAKATEWYAEGRKATRDEVDESINSGLHHLSTAATEQGPQAQWELTRRLMLLKLELDEQTWPAC